MHVSHITSGYVTSENNVCLTFYCIGRKGAQTVDVYLRNEGNYGFAFQKIAITDEYGDTIWKNYIPVDIRSAVQTMFREQQNVINSVKSEFGYTSMD